MSVFETGNKAVMLTTSLTGAIVLHIGGINSVRGLKARQESIEPRSHRGKAEISSGSSEEQDRDESTEILLSEQRQLTERHPVR